MLATVLAAVLLVGGCSREGASPPPPKQPDPHAGALARLRAFEQSERARIDFALLPSSDRVTGADPYALIAIGDHYVGILRGSSQLVLLDRQGHELHRVPAPRSPTGLAAASGRRIVVSGELATELATYSVDLAGGKLLVGPTLSLSSKGGALNATAEGGRTTPSALRDVAVGADDTVYVVDEWRDELIAVPLPNSNSPLDAPLRQPICSGPFDVEVSDGAVFVNCLIDHTLLVRPLVAGVPSTTEDVRIRHDGPIWSFDVLQAGSGARQVVLGGVEDKPLDRSGGFFGNVDSFAYVYRVSGGTAELIAKHNVSAHGVVTPKAIRWLAPDQIWVSGYGGERAAELLFTAGKLSLKQSKSLPPGSRDAVRVTPGELRGADAWIIANPLLDAWVLLGDDAKVVPVVAETTPDEEQRLGEALFFTTLMAPGNPTEGAHSSFSCETCHFEGYVDGRSHHTGRGDVHATTKPLLGLFNNKPHFTRALDPNLTRVAHAEFRVAGAESGNDPWFELTRQQHPWLAHFWNNAEPIGAEQQRKALMRFLISFTHRPNPHTLGRKQFSADERQGATVFQQRCVGCHAARLSTDDEQSEVDFERWEALVMSDNAPIVWASDGYQKTGVQPYVHVEGARTTSLRRLYKKRPYFTDGSAKTLEDVLAGVRLHGDSFFHAAAPAGAKPLSAPEQRALLSFLRLL